MVLLCHLPPLAVVYNFFYIPYTTNLLEILFFKKLIFFKIGVHPIFSMIQLLILRGLPLGCLSTVIPKALTIWLKNSSDPIGFPL